MNEILFKAYFRVSKHGILKNSKQIFINKKTNKPFISKSEDAVMSEKWLLMKLQIEKIKQRLDTIKCDIAVEYIFYFPQTVYFTKKNERSMRLPDLDNLLAMPNDCLQKALIIENDIQICSFDGCRREPINSTEYYLDITIRKFK